MSPKRGKYVPPILCSMFKWITCSWRHPLQYRRSILLPIALFMVTTGLLYGFIERFPVTNLNLNSLSLLNSTSLDLHCDLNNETQRAINLSSSDYCKDQLKKISCQINSTKNFFPKSLPRLCPIKEGNFGDIVGCALTDDIVTHDLNETQIFDTDVLCIDHCLKLSLSFAEYNELTHKCCCLSVFTNQTRLMNVNRKCTDTIFKNNTIRQKSATIFRTGYVKFGNHFEKNHSMQNSNQTIIVFFLTVGGRKNLRQIKRLVRSIYARQHYYLIHIDSREEYLHRELSKLTKDILNIHLTSKRFPTTWGSSTLLNAHLDAFKQIFEELHWDFSFILNLSESDFPLKPIQVLTNFLALYPSHNFLRTHNRQPFKFMNSQGIFHTFIQCENYMYRIGHRPLIQNIVYDGGSDWYILNRDFVHYVTYGTDELVTGLRHVFNYSLLPCESFFHTVLSNSIQCDTYIRNNLRLVHWNRERGCKCQHKHVVDWCGCSPVVYKSSDQSILNDTNDKPLFFARKFDPTIDEAIIDWLDHKNSRRNFSNGGYYLQNVYHSSIDKDNLDDLWKLLDSFARTVLIDYQQYRRNCFLDNSVRLQQIHSVFDMSIFQGYSVQYAFNDGEQIELFIKLNSTSAIHSIEVKRFEIGLELDSKELVFIDRSRVFIEPKSIKVLIEWKTVIEKDASLLISSPIGVVVHRVKIIPSNEPLIVDVVFPVISSPTMIGIWKISLVIDDTDNLISLLNFLVLLSHGELLLNNQYLKIMTNFWSTSDVCTTANNSSSCDAISNQIKTLMLNECLQQRWSSFYGDVKSDW